MPCALRRSATLLVCTTSPASVARPDSRAAAPPSGERGCGADEPSDRADVLRARASRRRACPATDVACTARSRHRKFRSAGRRDPRRPHTPSTGNGARPLRRCRRRGRRSDGSRAARGALSKKAIEPFGVALDGAGQKLQRDGLSELEVIRAVDPAHPAVAERPAHPVTVGDNLARQKAVRRIVRRRAQRPTAYGAIGATGAAGHAANHTCGRKPLTGAAASALRNPRTRSDPPRTGCGIAGSTRSCLPLPEAPRATRGRCWARPTGPPPAVPG